MLETVRAGGESFTVSRSEQARSPLAIYGPTPTPRAPLLLRVRSLRGSDRRALRDGVARRVRVEDAALERGVFLETELDDGSARALLPHAARAAIAGAVAKHDAVLQIRRGFVHLEIPARRKAGVSRVEIAALVEALAAVAAASRALPDAAVIPLGDPAASIAIGVSYVSGVAILYGVMALGAARLLGYGALLVCAAALAVGVASFVLTRSLARSAGTLRTTRHRRAFVVALAAGLLLGALTLDLVPILDRMLDTSPPVERLATIVSMSRHRGGAIAELCLSVGASEVTCVAVLPMTDDAFGPSDMGAPVVIRERAGGLGLPWVERIAHAR